MLPWLKRNAGWIAFSALVALVARQELRRTPTVDGPHIEVSEPRPAISYGAIHLTTRVTLSDSLCPVDAMYEVPGKMKVVLGCPREER
ncbi:MAG: hypothetical protein GWN53_17045 [Gammaproteobacteria bacterium]|uniref:Uncharacterized protein n=1 Tax=Candidatus Kutchimonas denitrificans TaxID=3056748 RepID=A0AAE4ZBJ4_9BACT|nr:hypothetical protein [Candidatus Kutchimonas denitrificans]NIV53548.1 hypothetical protein [Gammaproteobacteria bacterium]